MGAESVPGQAAAALKRLLDVGFSPIPVAPRELYAPSGSLAATTAVPEKERAEGPFEGRIGFETLPYLLSSLICKPVITTPGGATNTRRWTFKPNNFGPNSNQTYTMDRGGEAGGERIRYAVINSATFRINETESTVNGNMIGQKVEEGIVVTGNEVQRVNLAGATGGTFTLTFSGQTTAATAFDATEAALQAALEALSNIAVGDVNVVKQSAGVYDVEFRGVYRNTNVAEMTIDGGSLTGGGTATVSTLQGGTAITSIAAQVVGPTMPALFVGTAFTNAVQTIDLGTPSAGTWTITATDPLSARTATTAAIAFNAANTTVQSALLALDTIGTAGVAVTGSAGGPYTVTYGGRLAGIQVPALTVDGAGLTDGDPTVVQTTAGGLEQLGRAHEWEYTLNDRFQMHFTLDPRVESFSYLIENRPTMSASFTLQHDRVSQDLMDRTRNNEVNYLRMVCLGPLIENGFRYRLQFTFPYLIIDPQRANRNGVVVTTYGVGPLYHALLDSWVEAIVDCTQTAL